MDEEEHSPYGFMTFPRDIYIPKESKLIGMTLKDAIKDWEIDQVKTYTLSEDKTKRENLTDMGQGTVFEEGYILIIGMLAHLDEFQKEYCLIEDDCG